MADIDFELLRKIQKALQHGNAVEALTGLDEFFAKTPEAKYTEEQRSEWARSVLSRDHYNSVRGTAEDLAKRWRAGEFDDSDDFRTSIQQDCDGHQCVIYTQQAILTLAFSDNDGRYIEDFGEAPVEGGCINWSALAYSAFEGDVLKQLDVLGIDPNEDPPKPGQALCSACDTYQDKEDFNEEDECDSCQATS